MYCPLKFNKPQDISGWICEKKKCAWWSEDGEIGRCAVLNISNRLDDAMSVGVPVNNNY